MKTSLRKILSFVMVLCFAFICFFGVNVKAAVSYSECEFGEGTFFITTTRNNSTYYLPATATSSAPVATSFSSVEEISETHLWIVTSTGEENKYYIKNAEGKYLYTTSANNGVRVGDTEGAWKYDSTNNSLQFVNTSRFLGVYNGQDWRSYTSVEATNYKNTDGTFNSKLFKFYSVSEAADFAEQETLNKVESYLSLGYKYTYTSEAVEAQDAKDTLTNSVIGVSGTTYKSWEVRDLESAAVYKGQGAGGETTNPCIQLRTNNNNSGIVTSQSGGDVTKVVIAWNTKTSSGRVLNVYGSNTAYTDPTDLYSSSTQGELLGAFTYNDGETTTLEITGEYKYIGIKSNSGALYLDSIEISWAGEAYNDYTFTDTEFRIKCGVSSDIADLTNVDSYGIQVTADGTIKRYDSTSEFWSIDEENNIYYVVINLGDVMTNIERVTLEFTVQAYVEVDGVTYVSEISEYTKVYSVASLVKHYYTSPDTTDEVKSLVEDLYNILEEKGKIA